MRRNSPSEPLLSFEPEDLEIETTDGRRPASTAGDRMMVGLAAIALLGGALIAITNLLPDGTTEASQATATAIASRTPRPTPSPPPLRSVQVVSAPLPSPDRAPVPYEGWVRALEQVKIWSSSSSRATVLATLRPGDAALVQTLGPGGGAHGWTPVVAPEAGWIRWKVDGRAVIRRFPSVYQLPPGDIGGLEAHANGFVGTGWMRTPDGRYETTIFQSSDGAQWQISEVPELHTGDPVQVARGPAGWLLISTMYDRSGTPTAWVWQSEDMTDWQLLGAISDLPDGSIGQLVGSETGYVASTDSGFGAGGGSFWYSADGLVWSERRVPGIPAEGARRLISTPLGFYVDTGSSALTAAFSPDGWTWSEVAVGGMDTLVGLAPVGDQLVALDTASWGEGRAWTGTIRGSILTWREEVSASTAFDGAVLSAVTSDGQRPIAFGWDRRTDVPLWWIRDGSGWQRDQLPRGFEGSPRIAAGSSAGTVVVGHRPALTATNPVVWHRAPDGSWAPEAEPVIERQADPTPHECGDAPDDILEVMGRDSRGLAQCFGATPLTFRAWSSPCDGCNYEGSGTSEPEWLVQPTTNLVFLAPIASGDWNTVEGVLSPRLTPDPRWREHWVEVTGHFDDPAAASCRVEPVVAEEIYYDAAEVVNQCRGRFVITSVTVVRSPT
jgi:hypothetical protein